MTQRLEVDSSRRSSIFWTRRLLYGSGIRKKIPRDYHVNWWFSPRSIHLRLDPTPMHDAEKCGADSWRSSRQNICRASTQMSLYGSTFKKSIPAQISSRQRAPMAWAKPKSKTASTEAKLHLRLRSPWWCCRCSVKCACVCCLWSWRTSRQVASLNSSNGKTNEYNGIEPV